MSAIVGAVMTIVAMGGQSNNAEPHVTTQEYSSLKSCLVAVEIQTDVLVGASQSKPVKKTSRGAIYFIGGTGVYHDNNSGTIQFICTEY